MHSTRRGVVYVVTNDPVPNGNAVLTYLNDGAANLWPLPGSPFKTNGTGYTTKHVLPHFGPFGLDQNLTLSADAHRLFVPNNGSHSIAVSDIFDDGSLQPVPGSPFHSGGKTPVSIGLAGDNRAGTRAYTTNNASDTLSAYGLSNPRKPVEMTAIDLKGHGHPYQLALSSDDNGALYRPRPERSKRHRSVTAAS